jgi:type VI secretion system protein VasD
MVRLARVGAWLAVALLLGGCAAGPTPIKVSGQVLAAPRLNPDVVGRSSPVAVRIYQLRSAGAFSSADFFSLYEKDTAVLGQDLVGRDEILIAPGEAQAYRKDMDPAVRHLGILAAFRDLDRAQWRALVSLGEAKEATLSIRVADSAVSAALVGN